MITSWPTWPYSVQRSRQLVVANEYLDGTDVIVQFFGERQRTAHQVLKRVDAWYD
jgi:hypothetical protein